MTEERAWRPSRASRIGLYVFAVGMVAFALTTVTVAAAEGALLEGLAFAAVAGLAPAAVAVRLATRLRIAATAEALVIVSFASERRIPWSEVAEAYSGITVALRDGSSVLSGAVQKANVSTWVGRHTRADEVADYINRRAATS